MANNDTNIGKHSGSVERDAVPGLRTLV